VARIAETRFAAQVALRCSPSLLAHATSALGVAPSTEANTVAEAGPRAALWLGPDEWLITDEERTAGGIVEPLRVAFAGLHAAVVDVSCSRRGIMIDGPGTEDLLSQAATLDFHPSAFRVGTCAQTNLARTQGIIWRRSVERFVLMVRPSFSGYLTRWLSTAASLR